MMRLPLTTPLLGIRGISASFINRLEKMGVKTVRDLLWHFPSRYEDFSKIYKIGELEPGQHATIQGVIEDISVRRTWKRGMTIVEATIADESGTIRAVWFNQPYLAASLKPGRVANFAGKISVSDEGELYISHPAHELISAKTTETRHTARLVPVYPETKGLTSKGIRYFIQSLLKNIEKVSEWIPREILKRFNLPEINLSLKNIHFPQAIEEANAARKRFEFEDLFLLQLYNLQQKLKLKEQKAPALAADIEWLKNIIEKLPYELTLSQKKSLWEIVKDVEKPRPMNRLLQGDVGSGKTVVATIAAMIAAKNGYQTAFMAPTEVLARQHFETLKKLFGGISQEEQPTVALITSSEAKIFKSTDELAGVKKEELCEKIKNGEIKIVAGTHALIQETVRFNNLSLVIVDEQHRFGVRQRAALTRSNDNITMTNDTNGRSQKPPLLLPHFLSMSATPIPRTLMMTVFGDLDISLITELPAGRKNIITKIIAPKDRNKAYDFIRAQAQAGRQVFVICPRIESANGGSTVLGSPSKSKEKERVADSKNNKPSAISPKQIVWDVKSVKEEYEKLSKKIFPDLRIAMLHGKLKPKEKEKIMADFRAGTIDILVSTSVIEVGVDIPNATVMMIEGADRFGLAQLYQFRGRVGRGEHQSYCLLFTDSGSRSTKERMNALIEAKNGFELAEYDLKFRGPGELLGDEQSGMPDLAMQALRDPELVKISREAAASVLEKDRELKNSAPLKKKLLEFGKALHLE